MGNAISFRLNPKSEKDKQILSWLEEKSLQPGFLNQTEVIKKAILTAIEDEQKENREKSIEDWISEAILLSREEFIKIVQESSQNVANNMFAGVLGAMTQQMNAGTAPMMPMHMTGTVPNSMSGNMQNTIFNTTQGNVSKTTELSASLQGKNISVSVLESHTANSVDVRAINHDTGQYQNYQLKFGKDAKATIELLERGNYNNQRIVVPSEQLEEVQAYFKEKGSSKTITDHIDAWGTKGKSFTKEEMKALQEKAQREGAAPEMDYSHYQTKDLAMSIGKNAGTMALQAAAVTTGLNVAAKIFKGEEIDADELVEVAIKTGADTSIKTVTAGTLQVAIRKGIIKFISKATPAGVIANIACVGIENVKVLAKIASGELSVTKCRNRTGSGGYVKKCRVYRIKITYHV